MSHEPRKLYAMQYESNFMTHETILSGPYSKENLNSIINNMVRPRLKVFELVEVEVVDTPIVTTRYKKEIL
jgi:hypothetical protein